MFKDAKLTGLRPGSILLCGVALSLGWGIRGNFGHEYGAMIPGALTAIAVCLVSGRSDWRERVAYFGMFGALGWGFGGSISYMQVIGYTHSDHAPSVYYGFLGLFLIGFLWGGMGGAGTAFPAVADRDRLTAICKPLAWIILVWIGLWGFEWWLEDWATQHDATWNRHRGPLYWMDTDWMAALTALGAMGVYDLATRRFRGGVALVLLMAAGSLAGWLLQAILNVTGLAKVIAYLVVWPQVYLPNAARIAVEKGISEAELAEQYIYNWPNFMVDHPQYVGVLLGALLGSVVYFRRRGEFRDGASLFVYMASGWLIAFIALPVLLGFGGAGLRLTPPRGDDWAGILGVFIATMLWLRRNGLLPVVYVSLISATVGGLGFAGAAWIKLMLVRQGNRNLVDEATAQAWAHWQGANWHSFLEQTYGFINGVGIALALGHLARRVGAARPGRVPRAWTEIFAVGWVLFGVGWFNVQKNVPEWVENLKVVPESMKAPLLGAIELDAYTWFCVAFWAIAVAVLFLMWRHQRRPLAIVPASALGKGQLFFLVFLWAMVIANFERALPGFSAGRLLTEWVIILNAVLATVLVLVLPGDVTAKVPELGLLDYEASFRRARLGLVAALLVVGVFMPYTIRAVYEGKSPGHAGKGARFGEAASWKMSPLLKGEKHK